MLISEAIRAELGAPVLVRRLDSSPRSDVSLVEFDGAPAIVKHITGGPDAADRFHNEVTALRLAGQVRPSPVAALLAADPAARVLVLEHLQRGSPAEVRWSVEYAVALARLHSAPIAGLPPYRGAAPDDIDAFLSLAQRLDVPVPASAAAELRAVLARLDGDAAGSLLHGDPCPDNAVLTDDGIRFVDLEGAQRGPAMVELAYLRIGFPTCWCVTALPPAQVTAAEAAYHDTRRSLGHPATGGDLTDACVSWLIQGDALVQRAARRGIDHWAALTRGDWKWGTATARERLLHRLDVVATMTAGHAQLSGVAALTDAMRSLVRQRWPRLSTLPMARNNPLTLGD
ncbi:aminoglycoside phosphotransferase family protein [Dactylosporangium siamense]|uniref:aminoglycoside phosphotransferase family protein n=1 Tax=Dactylosporangium siamense TaxID=685454 RepID=UPI001944889F|nr:aminoglycoside phosphotransferase family protein [Dactylosporangium siamense]